MPKRPALALATGVTLTVVAWGILVFAAIDFGRQARDGTLTDWLMLAAATVGAVACMFLAIVLAARLQALLRTSSTRPQPSAHMPAAPPRPVRQRAPQGGHRAARR